MFAQFVCDNDRRRRKDLNKLCTRWMRSESTTSKLSVGSSFEFFLEEHFEEIDSFIIINVGFDMESPYYSADWKRSPNAFGQWIWKRIALSASSGR